MYDVELMISIGAMISSTLAGNGPKVSIISSLIIYRLILGIGAGVNNPLSTGKSSSHNHFVPKFFVLP